MCWYSSIIKSPPLFHIF